LQKKEKKKVRSHALNGSTLTGFDGMATLTAKANFRVFNCSN
jgi:hypothetical protein